MMSKHILGLVSVLRRAAATFIRIGGAQCAAAFAHYAFFSLFPLIILFVAVSSIFFDRQRAGAEIIAYLGAYVPIDGDKHRYVFDTLAGVVEARGQAGAVAVLALVWAASRSFATLIRATDRAWGVGARSWWRLRLESLAVLAVLACAALLGIAAPVLATMARDGFFPGLDVSPWIYVLGSAGIPMLALFAGLSLFYTLAPRRRTRFSEVWVAALSVTVLLLAAEGLFALYLKNFSTLNAVYGAFGGVMALLLWIYLSGGIFVFGACLCAAQAGEGVSHE